MAEERVINFKIKSDDNALRNTRNRIKELKAQMLDAEDTATFNKLALEAGQLETEIRRTEDAVRSLAGSGSELTKMNQSFRRVGSSLLSMDFAAAAEEAGRLAAISKTMNFGTAIQSVKQLSSTFMQMGKALLTNPFFLLVAVVVAIGVALYKLMDELGLVTVVLDVVKGYFEILMIPINALIDGLKALTDWFGWTNHAGEELAEQQIARNNELSASVEKTTKSVTSTLDHEIAMRRAAGEDTTELEREKLAVLQASADEQLRIAEDTAKLMIIFHGKDSDEYKEQMAAIEGLKEARLAAARQVELFEAKQVAEENKRIAKEAAAENERIAKEEQDELARIDKLNAEKSEKSKQYREAERKRIESEQAAADALELATKEAQRKADLMILEESLKQIDDQVERERALAEFREEQAWKNVDTKLLTDEQIQILQKQHLARMQEIKDNADAIRKEKQDAIDAAEKAAEDERVANGIAAAEELAAAEENLATAKRAALAMSISALNNFVDENSKLGKVIFAAEQGLAAAEVIINAIKEGAKMKAQLAAGTALAFVNPAAGAAMVAGAKAGLVMNAASTAASLAGIAGAAIGKFSKGATPTASGGGGGGGSTPAMGERDTDVTPSMNLNNREESNAGGSNERGKVMVVDYTDIADKGKEMGGLKNRVSLA